MRSRKAVTKLAPLPSKNMLPIENPSLILISSLREMLLVSRSAGQVTSPQTRCPGGMVNGFLISMMVWGHNDAFLADG